MDIEVRTLLKTRAHEATVYFVSAATWAYVATLTARVLSTRVGRLVHLALLLFVSIPCLWFTLEGLEFRRVNSVWSLHTSLQTHKGILSNDGVILPGMRRLATWPTLRMLRLMDRSWHSRIMSSLKRQWAVQLSTGALFVQELGKSDAHRLFLIDKAHSESWVYVDAFLERDNSRKIVIGSDRPPLSDCEWFKFHELATGKRVEALRLLLKGQRADIFAYIDTDTKLIVSLCLSCYLGSQTVCVQQAGGMRDTRQNRAHPWSVVGAVEIQDLVGSLRPRKRGETFEDYLKEENINAEDFAARVLQFKRDVMSHAIMDDKAIFDSNCYPEGVPIDFPLPYERSRLATPFDLYGI